MRKRATKTKKEAGIGSSFEEFLREEGIYGVTEAIAIKRVLAWKTERLSAAHPVAVSVDPLRSRRSRRRQG